ncbi:MAG: hypothetical protein HYU33_07605, partial [Candidatus Omnitrophica bacterium]|nr:hypothetical protein [Candidatus Omnitrophota bacterium]
GHTVANRVNHLLTLGRALEQFGPHLRQPVTPSEAKELLRAAENAALPQALHGLVNPRTAKPLERIIQRSENADSRLNRLEEFGKQQAQKRQPTPNDLARLPLTEPNLLQRLGTPFADASRAVLGGVSHPRQSARQIYGFRHTIQSVIDTWQYQRLQPKTQDIDRLAVRLGIPPENRAAALPQLIRILRPSLSPEQVQQMSSQLEALQTFPAARNRVMISEFIGTATGQRPFFLQLMNDPRRWTNVVQEVQKGMKQDVPTPKVFQVAGAIYASRMSPSIPQRMDFSRFGHSFFSGIFGRFNSPLAQRLLTSVSMSVTAPITLPITLVWQTVSLVRSGFGEIRQWGSLTNGQRAGAVLKLTAGLALPVSAFLILPAISTAVVTTTVGALGISAIHPIAWMLGSTVTSLGVSSAVGNVLINAAAHLTPLALTTAINRLNGNATSVPTLQQKAIGTIRQFDQVITGPLRDQPEVASAYDAVARLHALSAQLARGVPSPKERAEIAQELTTLNQTAEALARENVIKPLNEAEQAVKALKPIIDPAVLAERLITAEEITQFHALHNSGRKAIDQAYQASIAGAKLPIAIQQRIGAAYREFVETEQKIPAWRNQVQEMATRYLADAETLRSIGLAEQAQESVEAAQATLQALSQAPFMDRSQTIVATLDIPNLPQVPSSFTELAGTHFAQVAESVAMAMSTHLGQPQPTQRWQQLALIRQYLLQPESSHLPMAVVVNGQELRLAPSEIATFRQQLLTHFLSLLERQDA